MANSEKLNLDEYDFGSEFDFDEFSLEPKPVKTKREAIERIGEGAWEGAKETVKSASFFRDFVKKALPRGYGDMLDLADQGATTVRELYNEGVKESKPMLKDVGRLIDKMMPSGSKYLPKSAEKVLKNFADDVRDKAQTGVGANTANDMAVAAMLADTFKYDATESARREAKQDARETIRDAVNNKRHNLSMEQLDGIRRGVVSMAAYQRRIEFNYHKRSLELQARHYYVSVDMLNETKRNNLRTAEMLQAITHNTALPDLIKLKTSEKFKDMLRNKLMGGLQDGIFGQRNNFVQNLGKAFREQAIGSLRNFAGGVRDGVSGIEMAADSAQMAEEMGMDRWRAGGNALGGVGASWLGKLAASKVGKKIMGSNNERGKSIRRMGNKFQHFVENVPQIANDWSHRYTDAEDSTRSALENSRLPETLKGVITGLAGLLGDPLMDLAKGTIRRASSTDTQVKEKGIADLYAPTQFSNQAHKSLVEVIPGYLARIYQELQITRTGDTSIDLTSYDFSRGSFSSTKALRKAIFNKLFDEGSRNGVKREKDHLLEMIDPSGMLNPQQREELSKILANDNLRGRAGYETGRISNYTKAYNFGESQHGEKFAELFKKLADKNNVVEGQLDNEFANRFRSVGRSASDRRGEIQQLLEVYPRDMLEDMGLLKPGSTQIDMDKINSYFSGANYRARGIQAMGGVRPLSGGRRAGRGGAVQIPRLPAANDEPPSSPIVDEIKKLIDLIEQQNTKPLVSDIKELLVQMHHDMATGGGVGAPSTFDRIMDGASSAAQSVGRGARRMRRQAKVSGRRFMNQHQAEIDAARKRAEEMAQKVRSQARRMQRQAQVQAGRMRQRYQPQIDQASQFMGEQQQRAQNFWDNRPSMDQLGGMLRSRWDQLRGHVTDGYDYLHGDEFRGRMNGYRNRAGAAFGDARARAQGIGSRIHDNLQQATEELRRRNSARGSERSESNKSVFDEIKDILLSIRDRLEDGIVTTGGVPEGRLRRMAGGARRGLSRLNMRLTDVVKGGFGLMTGTARLGAKVTSGLVGGSAKLGWNVFKGTAGLAGDAVGFAVSSQYRRARGFIDIYVGNERKPRLYGRMLQEGNVYFDKESGKPIRRLKDITGDVVSRKDGVETTVLEADEIDKAWQKVGPIKKTLKALGATAKGAYGIGKKIFGVVTGGIPPVFKMALWGAKKAWGLLDMAQDIFVKGQLDSPAMTARLMRAGAYYSATSYKLIKRPSQIDGPVLIGEGEQAETVLTHDDIRKGLVDKNGKPIKTGLSKLLGWALGGIKRAGKFALKAGKMVNSAATGLVKGGWRLGKALLKGGVTSVGGAFDIFRGKNPFAQGPSPEVTAHAVELQSESTTYLKEIRDLLKERLPQRKKHKALDGDDDGIRDGSYEDQQKHKKEEEEKKAKDGVVTEDRPGFGTRMKAGAKSWWDKLRGKKDEEDDDTDINIDGGSGDSKNERRKRRLARRPGGSWKTSKGFMGKSKFLLGKGLGYGKTAGKWALSALPWLGLAAETGIGAGAVAGAGSAILGGMAAAGAAVLGVLASPVVLGAAAVAAVATAGYFGYKYLTRKKLDLLSRVRYVQYGFAPTDKDHVATVFGLEDKLKDAIIYGKEGAQLDPKRIDPKSLFKDFDVDEKDKDAMNNWLGWFSERFRSVFLTHVTSLKTVASDKWLDDVDGLDPTTSLKYLNLVRFSDGPYNYSGSPFKDLKGLPSGAGDVKAVIEIAETELKKKAPKDGEKAAGVAAGAVAGAVATATAKGAGAATTQSKPGVSAEALAAATIPASAGAAKGGQVMAAGSSTVLNSLGTDKLDGVDVVRLKAYGLVKMEVDKVKALQALEKYLTPKLVYNKNLATWSGSVEQVVLDNGPAFGVDSSNDGLTANWISWFNQRFLPVYLNYASLMKAQTGKDDPADGKVVLKANQAVDVATALFTTSGSGGSVWNVGVSPWDGYDLNTDVRSTDGNMQGLKDMAKSAVLVEPGGKAANQPSAGKSAGNSQTVAPAPKPTTGIMGSISNFWQSTKAAFSQSPNAKYGGSPATQVGGSGSSDAMPSSMTGGREMAHPGKGTGGDINAIPKPTGNKSWAAVKDTILAAAKMVGVDGKLMAAMAAIESGFDHTVRAGTSSATGLYQFISSTWDWMLKKYGSKYGIAPGTPATDARANALMGAEYLKENISHLEGKLGRPVTDTDMYFAHFLGSGDAVKFLTADPNAIGAQIMPKAAAANRGIFFSKNGGPLSVGQIYQLVNSRLQNKSKGLINDGGEAIVATSATTAKGEMPAPNGGTAAGAAAEKPTADKVTPAPVGIGAPGSTAGPGPTAAPMPQPTSNGVPIGTVTAGFMPPRPMQDQVSAAKQQNDIRVSNLEGTNKILEDSLTVHRDSFEVLKAIRDSLANLSGAANNAPKQDNNATPSSQQARVAERRQAEMPRPPVSVARPRSPVG
jgi:hypothetical protein